jgi:hypothetical protein
MLLDALFSCREGSDGPPLKNVMLNEPNFNYNLDSKPKDLTI